MLKIITADFITSSPSLAACPTWTLPEIAMVGRSNVGKSSLINTLTSRKNLAKTSNTPGKTRLLNFYEINNAFSLVDLPGYGYAKVSKTMQAAWQKNFQIYLTKRPNPKLVIQLIDIRHGPQENDTQMLAWLEEKNIPVIIILTKVDKISRNILSKQINDAAKALELSVDQLFPFSAESGFGKDSLLKFIDEYLKSVS